MKKIGECLYFLIQMRLLVCLIILFCSLSFAEVEGDSVWVDDAPSRPVGLLERMSILTTTGKEHYSLGWDVTAWTNHIDYNMGLWLGKRIANGLYLNALGLNLHILSDVGDSCTNSKGCARFGAGSAFNTAFVLIAALQEFSGGGDNLIRIWKVLLALQNPTLEYFVVRKYFPVSIALGYNTDWFAFSPGHKFYFRAHGDLNVNILFVRVAASFSYSFLDTYDLKKSSKKFYLKLIFGPIHTGF